MSIRPSLADLLPDFADLGRDRAPAAKPAAPLQPAFAELSEPAAPAAPFQPAHQPPVDMQKIIAAEIANAESRIRQELGAAYEADLNAERGRLEQRMAELQASLGTEAGNRIAAGWDGIAAQIATITTGATARILASLLTDDVTRRSIDELAKTIRTSLADRDAVRFRIAGPSSLFENLREALGPLAAQCDFTEAPGFDLNVAIEGSVIETRLAEWSAKIGEAGL